MKRNKYKTGEYVKHGIETVRIIRRLRDSNIEGYGLYRIEMPNFTIDRDVILLREEEWKILTGLNFFIFATKLIYTWLYGWVVILYGNLWKDWLIFLNPTT